MLGNCTLHIFALWKCANVRLPIMSLFKNVEMFNCTFCCFLKMCKCAIAHFVALKKCENVRSNVLLCFKNVRMCDRTFCHSLKKCKKVWSHKCSFEMSEYVKMCKKVQILKSLFLHFNNRDHWKCAIALF